MAVLMMNSPSYLELYFGTASIGAAIVPVNIRWSAGDIEFSIRDSGAKVFVTDETFAHIQCDSVDHHVGPAGGGQPLKGPSFSCTGPFTGAT